MATKGSNDRIAYDTNASSGVQSDISGIIGQLETLMGQRDAQVNAAMADFQADGVSDDYHQVEQRWRKASGEVRTIISLIKNTLELNDGTAGGTQAKARQAVQNIG